MCTARVSGTGLRGPPVPPLGWLAEVAGPTEGAPEVALGADAVAAGALVAGWLVAAWLVGGGLVDVAAELAGVVGAGMACEPLPVPQAPG